jgi:methenyltetrahydrofolate cyclohydrolase
VEPTGDLLELTISAFLDNLASDEPAPAGGSCAALAVALGAGLVCKVARASTNWPDARAAIAQAEHLRSRTAPLAQSDADAYLEAIAAFHLPDQLESEVRDMALGQVLARAAEIPLVIAEAGADVATLAAAAADRGTPELRGEAVAAALLADAGTRAAAFLVAANLSVRADDERVKRAWAVAEVASAAARNALATAES